METLEAQDDGAPAPNPKPPEPETLDPCPAQRRRRAEPRASRTGGRGHAKVSSEPVESPSVETLVSSDSSSKENPFRAGDLVWGKIKGHQWWPGKVVDPSEQHGSMDHQEEDRSVLVAFFGGGGGGFVRCEQSQLRPFKEGFNQMVKHSSSSSFVRAVKDALNEVRKFLDSEFACYCVVEKDPAKDSMEKRHFDEKYGVSNGVGALSITNCSPRQFLEHLRETARDVLVANMLEVTMFLSWAAAIKRSNCCSVHFGEVYADQVDECEPNGFGDADKNKVEEGCQVLKHRLVKGPDISKESNRKKERSIAELIGVTDSVKAEIHDDQEEKENISLSRMDRSLSSSRKRKKRAETDKSSNVENGGLLSAEEMSSDRRERKKSKYLLPPFTFLGGHSKRPLYTTAAEDGMLENEIETPQATPPVSPSSSLKQGSKTAHLPVDDDDSVEKILYEFLAAASDHLHLKRNHSVRPVKYFFDKFRSYAYTEGSEFESYKHVLDGAEIIDTKSARKDMGDGSRKGKSSGRRIKKKAEANGNTSLEQSSDMNTIGKDKEAFVETRLVLDLNHVNGPEEVKPRRKRRTKKSDAVGCDAGGEPLMDLMLDSINPLKKAILQNKASRSKSVDNDNSPFLKGHKLIYQSETSNADKKKSRKAANGESVVTPVQVHANGPEESRPRQKKEKVEGTEHRNVSSVPNSPTAKTPLPYIKRSLEKMISKLHGSTAHEKESGRTMRLRPEVEMNLLGEMECMLEKVNKLLTVPCAGTHV